MNGVPVPDQRLSAGYLAGRQTYTAETRALSRLGFWSALLSALFGIGFDISVIVMYILYNRLPQVGSSSGWTGMQSYLETFHPILLLPLVPSILLVPAFVTLMVCIHYYAAPEKRIWSHIGLAFTLIYACLAFTNYITQLVSVQRAVLAGETDGLTMLVHGNPHSIFWSLISAYVFMNLAMLFAAPVFAGGRLETWLRRLFLLNGASVVLSIATLFIDNPMVFNLVSVVVWGPIFTAAAVLLVVLFSKENLYGGKNG